jgi:hypothetical protein
MAVHEAKESKTPVATKTVTPAKTPTPKGRDLTTDERKHIDRIEGYNVEAFIAEHPDAPSEGPTGRHYGETMQDVAMLTNSVTHLRSITRFLNDESKVIAEQTINSGLVKITRLTTWLGKP